MGFLVAILQQIVHYLKFTNFDIFNARLEWMTLLLLLGGDRGCSWFQKLTTPVSDALTVTSIRQQMLRHCSPVSHESLSLPHEPLTSSSTAPIYATTSDLDRWTLIRDSDPAEGGVAPARGRAEAINDAARCISKRRYWSIIACPGHDQSLTFWPMTSTDLSADSLPTVRHTLTGVETAHHAALSRGYTRT